MKTAVAVGLFSAVCAAQAAPMAVVHNAGQTEVPASPEKTVVLDLALLDVLHSLDVPVVAVPNGRFTGTLKAYGADSVAKVGSMFEPDIESIRTLQADFILVGRRSGKAFEALQELAPTVDLAFNQADLVPSVKQVTMTLADLYGKQEKAALLIDELEASVAALQKKAAHAGKGLLVLTTGGKVISQGPSSRFGVLFTGFGVQPAMTDFPEGKGVVLDAEKLQQINPDWIYVIDRDASLGKYESPAASLLEKLRVERTVAGKSAQIVYLDPANWYLLDGAGLGAFQDNVNQLSQALDKK